MQTYEQIARITKPKGLDGKIAVRAFSDLYVGQDVWIVPPTSRGIRHTTIEDISDYAIKLAGVDDRSSAYELQGKYLLAACSDVRHGDGSCGVQTASSCEPPSATSSSCEPQSGCAGSLFVRTPQEPSPWHATVRPATRVYDKNEYVGDIDYVEQTPAHPMLILKDGAMIPYVDDFIVKTTEDAIYMDLPSGLLEINK
ncbi:MAG: hypothetical protein LBM21_02470 [Coriobacteriales bacterium]|jgi:ribosomal 30S subunit maturation factor RimM|nr:hypothetical protein [Coriobacteriales bacterium]